MYVYFKNSMYVIRCHGSDPTFDSDFLWYFNLNIISNVTPKNIWNAIFTKWYLRYYPSLKMNYKIRITVSLIVLLLNKICFFYFAFVI